MASSPDLQPLLIKIDASYELLQRNLAQATRAYDGFVSGAERSAQRYDAAQKRVQDRSGQLRAAQQQLGFQISDVATQFASGSKPLQIFGQQFPQIIQALALMLPATAAAGDSAQQAGGQVGELGEKAVEAAEKVGQTQSAGSRFVSFLSGPWGVALTAAVIVLAPLVSKLFEAEDALIKASAGADALGRAQGALGGLVDLTTGKIKSQNEALRLNAALTAYNLRQEAELLRQQAKASRDQAARPGLFEQFGLASAPGAVVGVTPEQLTNNVRKLLSDVDSGALRGDQAFNLARTIDLQGSAIGRKELLETITRIVDARDKEARAGQIDEFLSSGKLPAELKNPPRGGSKQVKEDPFPGLRDRFDLQIAEAQAALLGSAEAETELARKRVEAAAAADVREVQLQAARKEISASEAAILRAKIAERSKAEQALIDLEERERLRNETFDLETAGNRNAQDLLREEAGLARTQTERRRIALRLLDLAFSQERAEQEAVLASERATEAQKRIAKARLEQLNSIQPLAREAARRGTFTPLEGFIDSLPKTTEEINEAIEGIEVQGLRSLNDGIVDAITGARSLGDVFKNVANQIIADLLRIAVQRSIIEPLAGALFPSDGGGLGGIFRSLFGGARANGGPVSSGRAYLVGERGPELFLPRLSGSVVSNSSLANSMRAGGGGGRFSVEVVPSDYFDVRVREVATPVAATFAQGAVMGGAALAQRKAGKAASRRMGRG
jgi:hypothetical protein